MPVAAVSDDHVAASPRRTLLRLASATFVAYSSYAMCRVPLLPLFARDLGASATLTGLVMASSTLTGAVLKLPAGALSDVLGRRRLLLASAVVFAVLPFTYFFITTLSALVLLRFVHGSATAIFGPVATASFSDVAPADRRGAWLSTYSTAQNAGQALGPIVAGYLITVAHFDLAFLASGLIGLGVLPIVFGYRDRPRSRPPAGPLHEFRTGIVEVARDRLVLMTSGAQAAQFVLNGTLNAFLPLYGRETLGLTVAQLGWLFGAQTLTTLAVRPAIGLLSDRAGRRWVIVTGLTVCSAAVFVISLATEMAALIAAVVVYAIGVATTTAATSAFITDITRRCRYGAAHGVFGTIYDIGDALGPITAGVLASWAGYTRMFQVMAVCALAMAIGFALVSRSAEVEPTCPGC